MKQPLEQGEVIHKITTFMGTFLIAAEGVTSTFNFSPATWDGVQAADTLERIAKALRDGEFATSDFASLRNPR